MVEHQSHPKKMENLNIIIEINEEGEMSDFDISLRNELPYKNTDEYEYVVEEFEKVKEVNHKKLRCLLARELNCFACSAIYRFQLVFVRRRRKVPVNNVQYVVVNQRKPPPPPPIQTVPPPPPPSSVTKTVRVIPKATSTPVPARPTQIIHRNVDTSPRKAAPPPVRPAPNATTVKVTPTKTIAVAQNTVRGRLPQNVAQRRVQQQITEVVSSEEDIETEVIDSSMVEVHMESSNSPQPQAKRLKTTPKQSQLAQTPTTKSSEPPKPATPDDSNSLKCDLCNKEFHSARQRQRHRITHIESNNVLNCKKCNKAFLDRQELVQHEKTHTVQARNPRKSEGGTRRKAEEEEVLIEIPVTEEEEIIQDDNVYVQEV